jgi:cell division protein FtsB
MKITTPDFLKSRWFLVISLTMVGWAFFVLGKMVWQNYQVNQQIRNLENEISEIETSNEKLSDLISYFQTETYKEQEAREKLGLVMPGEKVLVFPEDEDKDEEGDIVSTITKEEDRGVNLPNYKKWWNFFFK